MTHTPLDPRIAEALSTIGAITELDYVDHVGTAIALDTLAQIVRKQGEARGNRLLGNIDLAVRQENTVQRLYKHLPEAARW